MRKLAVFVAALAGAGALAAMLVPSAYASPSVRFGLQDDAWLAYGPGTLEQRLTQLDKLGVKLVRYTLRWDQIAARRPPRLLDHGGYEWGVADAVLEGLAAHRIAPVLTLTGTPAWANGGRRPNVAPRLQWFFSDFAYAAARRYPFVRYWTIWNEPNQRMNLTPTSPRAYVNLLLNPAYAAIKRANPRALVAGGVTAPRGNSGGVSPLGWIKGMGLAHARLDAYAHNPYPLKPHTETPFSGGCGHCTTATMATLERLIASVHRWLGRSTRIWLTEYGYQTNPPDLWLGVSPALQARYVGEAGLRVWKAPFVDMLIHFMLVDDAVNAPFQTGHWQSGLFWVTGRPKLSYWAFMLPLAQLSRQGTRTVLWGQIRPRSGRQCYLLQQLRGGRWYPVGDTALTGPGGMLLRTVNASANTRFRIWSPSDHTYSRILTVHWRRASRPTGVRGRRPVGVRGLLDHTSRTRRSARRAAGYVGDPPTPDVPAAPPARRAWAPVSDGVRKL